jgi:hypothetical protein
LGGFLGKVAMERQAAIPNLVVEVPLVTVEERAAAAVFRDLANMEDIMAGILYSSSCRFVILYTILT